MKKTPILSLILFICCICNAQEQRTDSCQNEKYDFVRFDNECCELIENPDGTRTAIGHLIYREYPKDSSYYYTIKRFYESGNIKEKGKLIPSTLKIGIWEYYDEQGCLTATVDEDARFRKVKPEDVLNFAVKNQRLADSDVYYNVITKDKDGSLDEIKSASAITYNQYENRWTLKLINYPERTIYHIDGDTGDILSKDMVVKSYSGETVRAKNGKIWNLSYVNTKTYKDVQAGLKQNIYDK